MTTFPLHELTIDPRHGGIPGVAHGGYVSGLLAAALLASDVTVRLRRPVPTGTPLTLQRTARDRAELREGDTVLVEGVASAGLAIDIPPCVSLAEADAAARRWVGHGHHLLPGCFACGTERPDGLRIFPGPVAGRRMVAAPWTPTGTGRVPAELVTAALDCPQLWALIAHEPPSSTARVVTSTLAVRLEEPVAAGEPHVVTAWPAGRDEGSRLAGAAVLRVDGTVCALGLQRAVPAKWGVPLGLDTWRPAAAVAA